MRLLLPLMLFPAVCFGSSAPNPADKATSQVSLYVSPHIEMRNDAVVTNIQAPAVKRIETKSSTVIIVTESEG